MSAPIRKLQRPSHLKEAASTATRQAPSRPAIHPPAPTTHTHVQEGLAPRKKTRVQPEVHSAPRFGFLGRYAANSAFGLEEDRRRVPLTLKLRIDKGITAGNIRRVEIQGAAGSLSGYFHPPATAAKASGKTVLFLSGSGAPVEELALDIARAYQQQGFGVLTMNYRGFGKSEGEPSEEGFHEDAMAMLNHLSQDPDLRLADSDIVLHGYSMGAPIAARLATELHLQGRGNGGLFLDRPMPSMSKAVRAGSLPVWGRIAGKLAKESLGTMSVEKNLQGLPSGTRIFMSTDNEGMGRHGEVLRKRLQTQGFEIEGGAVDVAHEESHKVMASQFDALRHAILDGIKRHSRLSSHSRPSADGALAHPSGEASEPRISGKGHRRGKLSADLRPSALLSAMTPIEETLRKLDGTAATDKFLAVPSEDRAHGEGPPTEPIPPGPTPTRSSAAEDRPVTPPPAPVEETDEDYERYLQNLVKAKLI
jgi:pimeloyl-ACP methyl ester carboxylesterase